MTQVGIVYVAFGAPYLAMALTSILSLIAFNPTSPVCVVTNVCKNPPKWWSLLEDSHWTFIDEVSSENRTIKTNVYRYSPFEKTLYLDCDTLVLSDISQISFFLGHFDVLLRHTDLPRIKADAKQVLFDGTVRFGDIGGFNGGVIGFRKGDNVERFFDRWGARYRMFGKRDQPSLVEALYLSDVRLLPLPRRWNQGDPVYRDKIERGDVAIWHYKVRMDRHLESYILRVSQSFFDDPKDLDQIEAFIQNRRKSRGYGRSPVWLLKALIAGMRGPLSKLPPKHIGEENWNQLLAAGPPGGR